MGDTMWVAAPLAMATAMLAMQWTRTTHPPGQLSTDSIISIWVSMLHTKIINTSKHEWVHPAYRVAWEYSWGHYMYWQCVFLQQSTCMRVVATEMVCGTAGIVCLHVKLTSCMSCLTATFDVQCLVSSHQVQAVCIQCDNSSLLHMQVGQLPSLLRKSTPSRPGLASASSSWFWRQPVAWLP